MDFRQKLKEGFLFLDGATGSNLQEKGMESGVCPEQWILEHEEIFIELQKRYIRAGSDVLYAPTFTCNSIKLAEYGLQDRQEEMTKALIHLSERAISEAGAERKVYIAGDMTMTGEQLAPMGTLTFEELVEVYKEQVRFSLEAGVDLFAVETMMSLQECRAAVLAVKETCNLPVIVTLTYQEDMRTLYGTNPETAVIVLQAMGVDAVGLNCSTGPDKMIEAVLQMKKVSKVPIIAKPNAGLPKLINEKTCYDMNPDEFADSMAGLAKAGASVLGGCCGTTPKHMEKMIAYVKKEKFPDFSNRNICALTTERNTTFVDLDGTFMVVGERINPTGKKALQAQLKEGCFDLVVSMAEEQAARGAKILDVNMGMNGIDEKERMLQAVNLLTNTVDLPLSIDSSYPEVVEAALRIYPGRALINSISLETEKIQKLIPAAKKYGAMFILLPLSDKGLPETLEEKKAIINTILSHAREAGLTAEDIVVDGLVATIGANAKAALEVFETIRYCKEELGVATICGLSNISFGLPERQFVNSAFLTMAIGHGLTMAIANPSQTLLMNAALASDLLLNKKEADLSYINGVMAAHVTGEMKNQSEEIAETGLKEVVIKGKKNRIVQMVKQALEEGKKPKEIIDKEFIPGINRVGELFEEKKYFLPQLISSAETMEQGIAYLEPLLEKERCGEQLETIVMATVKGDIHDIGKNLVVLMLKNYGYNVIDLGKDVEAEQIIKTAKQEHASIIGLSALMTTTMLAMKDVIRLVQEEELPVKVIIGGAVITQSYADEIGADGYSKDASEAVKLVNRLLHRE